MNDNIPYNTSDEQVAERIVVRFIEAGLLPEAFVEETKSLLSSGIAKVEDWRLLAEKAIEVGSGEV